jgi:hypothetical protein
MNAADFYMVPNKLTTADNYKNVEVNNSKAGDKNAVLKSRKGLYAGRKICS